MTSPSIQGWIVAQFTATNPKDLTTKTFYLSNRPAFDDTNQGRYYPLLKSISGLGNVLGEQLPQPSQGSISFDNSPNSLGYERRLSDYFERYSPIEAQIDIYVAQTTATDFNITADLSKQWSGRVKTVSIAESNDTVTFSIQGGVLPKKTVGAWLELSMATGMPQASINKHVPVVFGNNVQVKPQQFGSLSSTNVSYAYACAFAAAYTVGGIAAYYAKDYKGKYVSVSKAATTSTSVAGNAAGTLTQTNSPLLQNSNNFAVSFTPSPGAVVASCRVSLNYGIASPPGDIKVAIMDSDGPGGAPGTTLAAGSAKLNQSTGTGNKYITCSFGKPVVLQSGHQYWFTCGRFSGTDSNVQWNVNTGDATVCWSSLNSENGPTVGWEADVNIRGVFDLFGIAGTDVNSGGTSTLTNGFNVVYADFNIAAAVSGQTVPDITTVDWVFEVNGIKDDGSGTLTGSANSRVLYPHHQISLLAGSWGGGGVWNLNAEFDLTQFTDTYTAAFTGGAALLRQSQGTTENRTSFEQISNEVLRNTAAMLVRRNSGKFAVYAWGTKRSTAAVLTDEEMSNLTYEVKPAETVINRLILYYGRNLASVDFSAGLSEGGSQFRNYLSTLNWDVGTNSQATYLIGNSQSVWGQRVLNQNAFDFILDSTTAQNVGTYYLAVYNQPLVYVAFEVPFFNYYSLELLDVVELVNPVLPSFFGTSPNAKLPSYAGTEVDVLRGYYLKRATRYRAQIEGREVNWTQGAQPLLKLTTRLLLNYPNDPT